MKIIIINTPGVCKPACTSCLPTPMPPATLIFAAACPHQGNSIKCGHTTVGLLYWPMQNRIKSDANDTVSTRVWAMLVGPTMWALWSTLVWTHTSCCNFDV